VLRGAARAAQCVAHPACPCWRRRQGRSSAGAWRCTRPRGWPRRTRSCPVGRRRQGRLSARRERPGGGQAGSERSYPNGNGNGYLNGAFIGPLEVPAAAGRPCLQAIPGCSCTGGIGHKLSDVLYLGHTGRCPRAVGDGVRGLLTGAAPRARAAAHAAAHTAAHAARSRRCARRCSAAVGAAACTSAATRAWAHAACAHAACAHAYATVHAALPR